MTGFLIFIVLVLVAIAIWQLTKIFDLTQIGASNFSTEVANEKDNSVNGYLMFAFVGFIYLLTLFSFYKWGHVLLTNPASEHGIDYDNLMLISFVIIFIVQTLTQFLLHYFAFKYRGKAGREVLYFADNSKLEFIWTIIPVIVLSVLIIYGLYTWSNIMFVDEEEKQNALIVEIYAKQFGWEIRYAGEDNTLGKANVRLIEGVNTVGLDMADKASQDDIVTNELHLPVGKKVILKMRSQDVLHSAYMPHFRTQMNCVPGMVTQFAFTPIVTTADMRSKKDIQEKVARINKIRENNSKKIVAEGGTPLDPYTFDYLLLCNKICGASHYNMQAKIVVESPEEFKKWLSEKPKLSKAIADANKQPEAELSTTTADSTKVIAQLNK